jgi:type I restriction enzyme R subunit
MRILDNLKLKRITTVEVIEELIKIAREIKKEVEKGKELNLSEQELSFYDLLSSKEKCFENYKEIENVAKEIVRELGYFIKVADWNRKDYVKAKIKAAVKDVLIRVIDGRISYKEIDRLSSEIITHAMMIYATA